MDRNLSFWCVCLLVFASVGCQPDFLDIKSNKRLVVPQTLKDLRAILDNTDKMNKSMPFLGELGADDYYVGHPAWESNPLSTEREAYVWSADLSYQNNLSTDWNWRYEQVFYSNLVLEGLERITINADNRSEYTEIKGSALFYRAWAFYQLAQVFCTSYDPVSSQAALGIPLKLESDIDGPVHRSTVEGTYRQILSDLTASLDLLPPVTTIATRPSKAAAHGLLSRVHLLMGAYAEAAHHAERALEDHNELVDLARADPGADFPLERFNREVIFHSTMLYTVMLAANRAIVDSTLYRSYQHGDLRKDTWFYQDAEGLVRYKGSFDGSQDLFVGIASGELYLILAECYARSLRYDEARALMEIFLQSRFGEGMPLPANEVVDGDLLEWIIEERRRELVFRGLRWSDLRRLNREDRFKRTLVRVLADERYELLPNDPRYVYPIPQVVIEASGIAQNER